MPQFTSSVVPLKEQERFWSFVEVKGPDECWEWKGRRYPTGYGRFYVRRFGVGYAHRLASYFTDGDIYEGVHVLHKCDNPPCCNPSHLFRGTHQDNMADRNKKGRCRGGRFGPRVGFRRLSEAQSVEIKRLYSDIGMTLAELASRYECGITAVRNSLLRSGVQLRPRGHKQRQGGDA